MAKLQTPRPMGKKHIARAQREAEQQRRILLALAGVGGLILLVLAIGLIRTFVILPRQPVARVGDTTISIGDYRERVRYGRYLLDEQAAILQAQLVQIQQAFPDNPELQQSLAGQTSQQLQQIQFQRSELDSTMVDQLIEEELILREAAKRGIEVSETEVTEAYQTQAAARAGGYTEVEADATVTTRAATSEAATATAELFTPTPTLTATEATITPTAVIPPPPTPTINVVAGDALSEAISQWETQVRESTGLTPEKLREIIRRNLLRQKVYDAVTADAKTTALQVHARHILVKTQDEANLVKARLDSGEDFAVVAAEVSTDTATAANGGDLGWFTREDMVAPFAEAAFSQKIGEIGVPVETQFGWHVIQVLEREERPLEGAALTRAKNEAFNTWLTEARNEAGVENLWTPAAAPPEKAK